MVDQKDTTKKKNKKTIDPSAEFFNFCESSRLERLTLFGGTPKQRQAARTPLSNVSQTDVLKQEPMGLLNELAVMVFLMIGVPNGVFTVPLITYLIGRFLLNNNVTLAFQGLAVLLFPLAIFPQPFCEWTLHSWMAVQVSKYFSCRLISEELPTGRPQILVAPPHGVFPYGNLLAMLAWPSYCGQYFMGLASSAALRPPIFKQILCSMGVIPADRNSARRALEHAPHCIGISSGGVAEIFYTNQDHEYILLKERVGLVKLAIRTGADLVPCYLFGNTKLLGCWAGEGIPGARYVLEKVSRKLGFALILIHGRFGLPIPHRVPILAVKGGAIPTHHMQCEEPTREQIATIQGQLIADMQALFDRHKALYGWEEKELWIR